MRAIKNGTTHLSTYTHTRIQSDREEEREKIILWKMSLLQFRHHPSLCYGCDSQPIPILPARSNSIELKCKIWTKKKQQQQTDSRVLSAGADEFEIQNQLRIFPSISFHHRSLNFATNYALELCASSRLSQRCMTATEEVRPKWNNFTGTNTHKYTFKR